MARDAFGRIHPPATWEVHKARFLSLCYNAAVPLNKSSPEWMSSSHPPPPSSPFLSFPVVDSPAASAAAMGATGSSVSPCWVAALHTELGTRYKAVGLCTTKNLGLWLSFLLCDLYCSPKCFSLSHYSNSYILHNWCCAWLFTSSFSSLAFCSRVLPH